MHKFGIYNDDGAWLWLIDLLMTSLYPQLQKQAQLLLKQLALYDKISSSWPLDIRLKLYSGQL